MKPHLKRKIIRKIVAALLDSELTASEIREFSKSVAHDIGFQRELGDLLGQLELALGHSETKTRSHGVEHLSPVQLEWLSRALALIQQRRKSKREVVEMLGLLRSDVTDSLDVGLTMRDILAAFASTAAASDLQNAERFLQAGADDPYLRGIMRRNEGDPT